MFHKASGFFRERGIKDLSSVKPMRQIAIREIVLQHIILLTIFFVFPASSALLFALTTPIVEANIIITEIMFAPVNGTEWIELYNNGSSIGFENWTIGDNLQSDSITCCFASCNKLLNNKSVYILMENITLSQVPAELKQNSLNVNGHNESYSESYSGLICVDDSRIGNGLGNSYDIITIKNSANALAFAEYNLSNLSVYTNHTNVTKGFSLQLVNSSYSSGYNSGYNSWILLPATPFSIVSFQSSTGSEDVAGNQTEDTINSSINWSTNLNSTANLSTNSSINSSDSSGNNNNSSGNSSNNEQSAQNGDQNASNSSNKLNSPCDIDFKISTDKIIYIDSERIEIKNQLIAPKFNKTIHSFTYWVEDIDSNVKKSKVTTSNEDAKYWSPQSLRYDSAYFAKSILNAVECNDSFYSEQIFVVRKNNAKDNAKFELDSKGLVITAYGKTSIFAQTNGGNNKLLLATFYPERLYIPSELLCQLHNLAGVVIDEREDKSVQGGKEDGKEDEKISFLNITGNKHYSDCIKKLDQAYDSHGSSTNKLAEKSNGESNIIELKNRIWIEKSIILLEGEESTEIPIFSQYGEGSENITVVYYIHKSGKCLNCDEGIGVSTFEFSKFRKNTSNSLSLDAKNLVPGEYKFRVLAFGKKTTYIDDNLDLVVVSKRRIAPSISSLYTKNKVPSEKIKVTSVIQRNDHKGNISASVVTNFDSFRQQISNAPEEDSVIEFNISVGSKRVIGVIILSNETSILDFKAFVIESKADGMVFSHIDKDSAIQGFTSFNNFNNYENNLKSPLILGLSYYDTYCDAKWKLAQKQEK